MSGKVGRKTIFICQQCGNENLKWLGQCPACGEWESLVETPVAAGNSKFKIQNSKLAAGLIKLSAVESRELKRQSTGFSELDRVLGGGLIPGQVVLLAGEPGIGKSTLLLQVAKKCKIQTAPAKILYISGEESPLQIKLRAERLGIEGKQILLYPETNVEQILEQLLNLTAGAGLIVVDSVQTLWSPALSGIPGSVGQVRLCSQKLIEVCKRNRLPLFLVGQVTKEGAIAGPKVLEHLVDTVLYLEGERLEQLRLLRCLKNRFGTVDELAVLRMEEKGLAEVADASKVFVETEREGSQVGAVLCPVVSGVRVILVELQSLVVATQLPNPRRLTTGFPRQRLEMMVAVLQKYLRLPLFKFDIFVNPAGGIKITDPGADLAVALGIYSSLQNKSLPKASCAFGELTLLAGIRPVLRMAKRRQEAKRVGLKHVFSPDTAANLPAVIRKLFS